MDNAEHRQAKGGDEQEAYERGDNMSETMTDNVYGDAKVFGKAQVYSKAEVFDQAQVYGDAQVFGDARVYGNARVSGGLINGDARIGSPADLCQIILDCVVWSRFPQADGTYRTTHNGSDDGTVVAPEWLTAALDAWQEARRG